MLATKPSILSLIVIALGISGCSTQQIANFESKVGAMRCVKDRGLVEGSTAHQECASAYAADAANERAQTQATMLGVIGAAAQVRAAQEQAIDSGSLTAGQPQSRSVIQPAVQPPNTLVSQILDANWNYTCTYADGTKINSGKKLCPSALAND